MIKKKPDESTELSEENNMWNKMLGIHEDASEDENSQPNDEIPEESLPPQTRNSLKINKEKKRKREEEKEG